MNATIAMAAICAALLIVAAIADVRSRTIDNWISVAIVVLGVGRWASFGFGDAGVGALVLGVVALAVGFGLYLANVFGGADAKLIAATLFFVGPNSAVVFLLAMGIAGALVTVAVVALAKWRQLPLRGADALTVPYGVAIAVGGLVSLASIVGLMW